MIASIPLLVTYAAGQGITDVVLPKVFGLRALLGAEATSGVVRLGKYHLSPAGPGLLPPAFFAIPGQS